MKNLTSEILRTGAVLVAALVVGCAVILFVLSVCVRRG